MNQTIKSFSESHDFKGVFISFCHLRKSVLNDSSLVPFPQFRSCSLYIEQCRESTNGIVGRVPDYV